MLRIIEIFTLRWILNYFHMKNFCKINIKATVEQHTQSRQIKYGTQTNKILSGITFLKSFKMSCCASRSEISPSPRD